LWRRDGILWLPRISPIFIKSFHTQSLLWKAPYRKAALLPMKQKVRDMEIITMESTAYKELVEKIDRIAGYVRENERAKQEDTTDVWLSNRDMMSLLGISRRTLQRLRDSKRIGYAIFRGACRYHFSEAERLVKESVIDCNPQKLEDFKRNYLLRTGGNKNNRG